MKLSFPDCGFRSDNSFLGCGKYGSFGKLFVNDYVLQVYPDIKDIIMKNDISFIISEGSDNVTKGGGNCHPKEVKRE